MIHKEEVRFNNLVEILTNRCDTKIPLPTGVYGYINEIRTDKFQIRLKNKVSEKEHLFTRRFESVRPILLTEEWHNKFGIQKNGFGNFEYILPRKNNINIKVIFCTDYVMVRQGEDKIDDDVLSIWNKDLTRRDMYVHEWQNFYYSLCGEELIVL